MQARIPSSPPPIAPVSGGERPTWSVMIPVYNCMDSLAQTLDSVLNQDPGKFMMQIEVVDDASTDGDVAALVAAIGKGRVGYFRQESNVGSLRNFETCLQRSRGLYVHLLHGDDLVKPGFYTAMAALLAQYPEAGSAICKSSYINSYGNETHFTPTLLELAGILPNWLERIAKVNVVQPPSIVVKRAVYEQLGGFFAAHYGEDWEMLCRVAAHFPVAYTPVCLAMYRIHDQNITSNAYLSGSCISDILRFIAIIGQYMPEDRRIPIARIARRNYANFFAGIAYSQFTRDRNSFLRLSFRAFRMAPTRITFGNLVRNLFRYFR